MGDVNQYQRVFENAELIIKHLKGELNQQEQEALNIWLEEDKRNSRFVETLSDEVKFKKDFHIFSSEDVSSAWQKVAQETFQKREVNMSENFFKWKYAAIVTFFLASGMWLYLEIEEKKPSLIVQKIIKQEDDVLPGGDKARLELADGSVVILEKVNDGSLQQQGGTQIIKQDGQLVYSAAPGNYSGEISYNKISTPKGGQYQVILPDGSKVWLNAESSLRFPTVFIGNERKVELTGEAYFEVEKLAISSSSLQGHKMVPFKVQTNNVSIEVLGTHFNVMAYANEKSVNTTLLEGLVRVSQFKTNDSQLLKPGQQAKVNGSIELVDVDTEEVIAWKNSFFQFNGADIQTVMGQIERWYDVEVNYEGKIPSKHFTGIISRNINVSKVLDMLELTGGVKFEIKGKRISVQNK